MTSQQAPRLEMSPLEESIYQKYLSTMASLDAQLSILKQAFNDFCRVLTKDRPFSIGQDGIYLVEEPKKTERSEKAPHQESSSSS